MYLAAVGWAGGQASLGTPQKDRPAGVYRCGADRHRLDNRAVTMDLVPATSLADFLQAETLALRRFYGGNFVPNVDPY